MMEIYTNNGVFIADVDIDEHYKNHKNHDHIQINLMDIAKNIYANPFGYFTAIIEDGKAKICSDKESELALRLKEAK